MKNTLIFLTIALAAIACSDDNDAKKAATTGGFYLDGVFYETTFGYASFASAGDLTLQLMDVEADGNYANETVNIFAIVDLTPHADGSYTGDFFYDHTESLPGGIDDVNYAPQVHFDGNGNAIGGYPDNRPTAADVTIHVLEDDYMDIEYEVTFDDGNSVTGFFKGAINP